MKIQRGTVVRSRAGHDKGSFFAVLETDGAVVLISDGRSRTSASPKKKLMRHLAPTAAVLSEQILNDDSRLIEALEAFNKKVRAF